MIRKIYEWVKPLVYSTVIVVSVLTFAKPLMVQGSSMYPTLENQDYLIMRNTHQVQRGDIITFQSHEQFSESELKQMNFIQRLKVGEGKVFIKRVIAVAGDSVAIKKGKVYVNGQALKEDYINEDYTTGDLEIDQVPEHKIFVLGDNRGCSMDSRMIGYVDVDDINGKIEFRVFPFEKIGEINQVEETK